MSFVFRQLVLAASEGVMCVAWDCDRRKCVTSVPLTAVFIVLGLLAVLRLSFSDVNGIGFYRVTLNMIC